MSDIFDLIERVKKEAGLSNANPPTARSSHEAEEAVDELVRTGKLSFTDDDGRVIEFTMKVTPLD